MLVFILDWDDTLLPSAWLIANNINLNTKEIPKEFKTALQNIEESVIKVLVKIREMCNNIIIITNAEAGWVQLSSRKFLPNIIPYLEGINTISARSKYEMYDANPLTWKRNAFQEEINSLLLKRENISVISIGDSFGERYALFNLVDDRIKFKKNIKLLSRPTSERLKQELIYLKSKIDYIYSMETDMDVEVSL